MLSVGGVQFRHKKTGEHQLPPLFYHFLRLNTNAEAPAIIKAAAATATPESPVLVASVLLPADVPELLPFAGFAVVRFAVVCS